MFVTAGIQEMLTRLQDQMIGMYRLLYFPEVLNDISTCKVNKIIVIIVMQSKEFLVSKNQKFKIVSQGQHVLEGGH